MPIRQLPPVLVNRIAAGEVIERPAAAVKELVENAIDAGADRIEITLHEGGQALIAVADNGGGMSPQELSLAVERHCTSKLPDDNLLEIAALGFRGEALPSIGAVSRLRIVSRPPGADSAWEIVVEAGEKRAPAPAAHPPGTRVEVRDLFFATPARLKFLKTPRSERDQAVDAVKRLAMAYPGIGFTVIGDDDRVLLRLVAETTRGALRRRPAPRPARRAAWAATSPRIRWRSMPSATGSASPGGSACRRSTAACRATSTSSSTAARCATGCWSARCAAPIRTCWRATATPLSRCSSTGRRTRSTSTSTRPRPRSAFATPGSSAG